jgi:hypothetical protein
LILKLPFFLWNLEVGESATIGTAEEEAAVLGRAAASALPVPLLASDGLTPNVCPILTGMPTRTFKPSLFSDSLLHTCSFHSPFFTTPATNVGGMMPEVSESRLLKQEEPWVSRTPSLGELELTGAKFGEL